MNNRSSGFTLLELLVFLVILATVAGAVTMSVSLDDPVKKTKKTALAFKNQFNRAQELAVLYGQDIGLFATEEGYEWLQASWETDENSGEGYVYWGPGDNPLFIPKPLDDGIRFEYFADDQEMELLDELPQFSGDEELERNQLTDPLTPLVVIGRDGESSPPFSVTIYKDDQPVWLLDSDGYNQIEMESYAQPD